MPTTNGSTTGIKQHLARNHEIIDPNYVPKLKTELPKFPQQLETQAAIGTQGYTLVESNLLMFDYPRLYECKIQ